MTADHVTAPVTARIAALTDERNELVDRIEQLLQDRDHLQLLLEDRDDEIASLKAERTELYQLIDKLGDKLADMAWEAS